MGYCDKCGNTGRILKTGETCECQLVIDLDSVDLTSLSIPEQYSGLVFKSIYVNLDLIDTYYKYMDKLLEDITSFKLRNKNIFICTPPNHGRSIFAYTCIQYLFRKNRPVFPLLDLGEIRRFMQDMDNGYSRESYIDDLNVEPKNIYLVEYLFVKVPADLNYGIYDTLQLLITRRTRRGLVTIIFSDIEWNTFADNDKKGIIKGMAGDGSFNTIEANNFWRKK